MFLRQAPRPELIQYRLPSNGELRVHRFAGSADQVLAQMPGAMSRFQSRVLRSPYIMSHTLPAAEVNRIADDVVAALAGEGRTAIVSTTFLDAGSTDDLDAAIKHRLRGTRSVEIDGSELSTNPQHRIGKLVKALERRYPKIQYTPSDRGPYFDVLTILAAARKRGLISAEKPLTIVVNGYAPKTRARDDLFSLLRDIAQDNRSFPYVRVLVTTPFLASGREGSSSSWFGAYEAHFFPQGQKPADTMDGAAEAK